MKILIRNTSREVEVDVDEKSMSAKQFSVEDVLKAAKEQKMLYDDDGNLASMQAAAEAEETEESKQTRDVLLGQLSLFKSFAVQVDESGVIQSISASAFTETAEDRENAEAVLESLQAAGVTPAQIVGDLAQTSIGNNVNFTGTTTNGSAVVTGVSNMTGLAVGVPVMGAHPEQHDGAGGREWPDHTVEQRHGLRRRRCADRRNRAAGAEPVGVDDRLETQDGREHHH